MTAVIYARYSSDNQREESIEGQIRECNAYAEKNGITVVKHYIDRAISAKTDNRPQFQQMIKDSERKLFDMVLVWKLDRFARNRYDSAHYKTQLKKNGVKLMSATEIISDGPEGIILESVLEGYAEYYSADLSEKVIRGMTENALKGKFTGGAVPVGYRIDENQRFQTDPLTAPLIAEAFRMYNEGATMTEVRDWLNEHQVKNPRGGPMSYNTVQHMLKNRRYIGELKYRDILIPDAIPPIVSPELFEDVQIKMAKNKKAPARRKAEDDYLLTTKLFCGYCGSLMFGESGTSRSGDVHRYYKCATVKKRKSCQKKTVRKQWLEDLVIAKTKALIMDDTVIDSIVSSVMELQNKENTNLPLYEKQLRDTETGIQNMLNAIQPQGLLVAQIVRLDLRNQRSCVVTAALGKAGTARACTGVLVLDEDLDRVDAGGVVRANRRADDDKLMGCRRTNAQMGLGRNDKRTDVQAGPLLMGYPILVGLDQRLDCLNKVLGRQRRQAHTMVGVLHTLCVAVGTEQLYRTVGQTVCLHALKGLHCIVQNHGSRVECERLIGHDACVMPSLTLSVVNDEHVVGVVFAKAQSRFVGLFFLVLGQFVADVEHDNFTLFC